MRSTNFGVNNTPQDLYFADDHPTMPRWFKGMEIIIHERGLWPQKGLNAQCEGFKCVKKKTDCCCRQLLFTQSNFENQKSHLEEFITSRGHICDFYPKNHCELHFIEQYWGAAKLIYRTSPKMKDIKEMEGNVKNSPVAPLSTNELTDFTSPVSVVSSSTFSLREVKPSSAEAMTSLDGSCRSHFGHLFRTISIGVTIGFLDMGFCMSVDGSTVSLREHVGKTEKQL